MNNGPAQFVVWHDAQPSGYCTFVLTAEGLLRLKVHWQFTGISLDRSAAQHMSAYGMSPFIVHKSETNTHAMFQCRKAEVNTWFEEWFNCRSIITRDVYIRQSSCIVCCVIMGGTMWHRDRIHTSPDSGYVLDDRIRVFPSCPCEERYPLSGQSGYRWCRND